MKKIVALFNKTITLIKTNGVKSTLLKMINYLCKISNAKYHNDILTLNKYRFILQDDIIPMSSNAKSVDSNTINWLIPDFTIGLGGHMTIFRFIEMLERRGYKSTICIVGKHAQLSANQARETIRQHFVPLKAEVVLSIHDLKTSYFSVATSWDTAYYLKNFNNTIQKLYFVQDFEPGFYPYGSEYAFAESTYRFGFTAITAGQWLSNKLSQDYKMKCYSIGFSYDKNVYKAKMRTAIHTQKVFCYCRPPTPRRGWETAFYTLDLVGKQLPNTQFIFAGWPMSYYRFPHNHQDLGTVSFHKLAEVYNECDVALVLSLSNLSLLPLEIMACECALVSNDGANVEWLLNSENCLLSDSSPLTLSNNIIHLLTHPEERNQQVQRAKQFAELTHWENEGDRFQEILEKIKLS